jgi:outer membrane cobalamin receptor
MGAAAIIRLLNVNSTYQITWVLLFFASMAAQAVELLPEYVVRAWHFESDSLDTPADVVIIGRETIENSAAPSLPDLLQTEANLVFRSSNGKGNKGEVAMRGFG